MHRNILVNWLIVDFFFYFIFSDSFNENTGKMDAGFPRSIPVDFPGIGSKVDAAFENYGKPALKIYFLN